MAAVVHSPFLCNYQDLRNDEEEFGVVMLTQSRCSVLYPRPSVCPGETMRRADMRQELLTAHSTLQLTQGSDWCEQTHLGRNMSGYMYQRTTSQLSDEHFFSFSPEHNENDFYQINTENPSSPQANSLGLQDIYSDNFFSDDSIMLDSNSNLDKEMNTWLPSFETSELDQTTTPGRNRDSMPHTCTQSTFALPPATIEEKKPLVKSILSIFDSEEPLIKEEPDSEEPCIKEEPDMFSTAFGQYEMKYDLEVAAEEEVITEVSSVQIKSESKVLKEELKEEPASPASVMENTADFLEVPDYLVEYPSSQELNVDWTSEPMLPPSASRPCLDIGAAMVVNTQLFGHSLVDTPEVLKPVLKPPGDFDLISFLLANGDPNNNVMLPSAPIETSRGPLRNSLLERRRGKGNVSMQELRASQLPSASDDYTDPLVQRLASESTHQPSSRPRRESASRFNHRLEQGLYDDVPAASDDEDFSPTGKRRRTISSSSSRRHTNYDSDVTDSYQKYRERRDRNNVSSKLSRQKRKMAQQEKILEMERLEKDNLRLKKKDEELASILEMANKALKVYLNRIHN